MKNTMASQVAQFNDRRDCRSNGIVLHCPPITLQNKDRVTMPIKGKWQLSFLWYCFFFNIFYWMSKTVSCSPRFEIPFRADVEIN